MSESTAGAYISLEEWSVFRAWAKHVGARVCEGYGSESCILDARHVVRHADGRVSLDVIDPITIKPLADITWVDGSVLACTHALLGTDSWPYR